MTASANDETGRVLWRCRRGMKELDVLLERYVRSRYAASSEGEKNLFAAALDLPDPLLADYLFGYAVPDRQDLAALFQRIAAHPG